MGSLDTQPKLEELKEDQFKVIGSADKVITREKLGEVFRYIKEKMLDEINVEESLYKAAISLRNEILVKIESKRL